MIARPWLAQLSGLRLIIREHWVDIWIFGYGSLIWRPDFEFIRREKAAVSGWRRRFCQASPDHRGVPHAPGRVVTLVPETQAWCEGVAYLLPADSRQEVLEALDFRERNGYERVHLTLRLDRGEEVAGLTYIADRNNPSYVDTSTLEETATVIARAVGPSGTNRDYLHQLDNALLALDIHDDEIKSLTAAVARVDKI